MEGRQRLRASSSASQVAFSFLFLRRSHAGSSSTAPRRTVQRSPRAATEYNEVVQIPRAPRVVTP